MYQSVSYYEILSQFLPAAHWTLQEKAAGGMNNTTLFAQAGPECYVLRIYETHQDAAKIAYEHHVLLALEKQGVLFRIPVPIMTPEGQTSVRLRDGRYAALFRFQKGTTPSFTTESSLYSFGQVTAQLSLALGRAETVQKPVYRPYYEIEHAHPACPMHAVLSFCSNPPKDFIAQAASLKLIQEHLAAFQEYVPQLKQLPHQLIHGDLNASNLLVDESGRVTAILDFEFVTYDLRVMELAVCLSGLLKNEGAVIFVDTFLSGYGSVAKVTEAEIKAIPLLIQLRRLDVFLHFLGRYWDGIDGADILQDQLHQTASQLTWLAGNHDELLARCADRLLTCTETAF